MYVESRVGKKPAIFPRATYCLASNSSEATGPASRKRKWSEYSLTRAGISSACLTLDFSPSAPTLILPENTTGEPFLSASTRTRSDRFGKMSRKDVDSLIRRLSCPGWKTPLEGQARDR